MYFDMKTYDKIGLKTSGGVFSSSKYTFPDGLVAYIRGLSSKKGPELLYSTVDGSDPLKYDDGSLYIGPAFTFDATNVLEFQNPGAIGEVQVDTSGTSGGNGYSVEMAGVEADGVELVENSHFTEWDDDDPVSWITSTETATNYVTEDVDGGARLVSETGLNTTLSTGIILEVGQSYTYTVEVTKATEGLGRIQTGYSIIEGSLGVGVHTGTFVADTTVVFLDRHSGPTDVTYGYCSIQKLVPYENESLLECYRGKPDGVELVTDGGFDDGSEWLTTAQIVIADGVCNIISVDGTYQYIKPSGILTIGDTYRLSYEIKRNDAGALKCSAGSGSYGVLDSNVGSHSTEFIATGSSFYIERSTGVTDIDIDNISIQKLEPIPMTTAVLLKMGVGSDDLGTNEYHNLTDVRGDGTFSRFGKDGTDVPSAHVAYDLTTYSGIFDATGWTSGEYHLKIVQVSEDGLTFRVGNKRYTSAGVAIDTDIVYSAWAAYDGSFDPEDYIRFGYDITVPFGLKAFAQFNVLATDEDITKLMEDSL